MLSDTHPEVEKLQIELLRKATPSERLAKALSLTATLVGLSRQTIARLNPEATPQELDLKRIELYYGKPLAEKVKAYLKKEEEHGPV
jgi:hypothetical protein